MTVFFWHNKSITSDVYSEIIDGSQHLFVWSEATASLVTSQMGY